MKLVTIEFTASASPYHAGDIAGFDEDTADSYIVAKLAKLYEPKGKAKAAGGKSAAGKPDSPATASATPAGASGLADADAQLGDQA